MTLIDLVLLTFGFVGAGLLLFLAIDRLMGRRG